jgi:hypothetical protein
LVTRHWVAVSPSSPAPEPWTSCCADSSAKPDARVGVIGSVAECVNGCVVDEERLLIVDVGQSLAPAGSGKAVDRDRRS